MASETVSSKLIIVYDNNPFDTRLKPAWGFACLVETDKATVLFDTGGDGPTLMGNLSALGLDPRRVDAVVLSHNHPDHIGGLDAVLKARPFVTVFVPRSFPSEFQERIGRHSYVVQVSEPFAITECFRTTGEVGTRVPEQSLMVQTIEGLILITACAHPGIVELVRGAKEFGDVYLVVGGLHLKDKSICKIAEVIMGLKRLGVRKVAPCHCTGEQAIHMLNDAFGADFIPAGVGAVIGSLD